MDKTVVFAVAGSGKTRKIVNRLEKGGRCLVLTYTENNHADIRRRVIERFGCVPETVTIQTYFSFLNRFCYRPLLFMALRSQGVSFKMPPSFSARLPLNNDKRYLDPGRRVYHCRMAKLLDVKGCIQELVSRIERYFDVVCVDEVQDFAGHDFNLLIQLSHAKVDMLLAGDFYQHTYDTSRDGTVNRNLHADYTKYRLRFEEAGFYVDVTSLVNSHRCSKDVCDFIKFKLGIDIASAAGHRTQVTLVDSAAEADRLYSSRETVKLFYQQHELYGCHSNNWGGAKGLDHFHDVCVVLNKKSWIACQSGAMLWASPITKNKLYVACSRARGNLYITSDLLFKRYRRVA